MIKCFINFQIKIEKTIQKKQAQGQEHTMGQNTVKAPVGYVKLKLFILRESVESKSNWFHLCRSTWMTLPTGIHWYCRSTATTA